MSNSTDNIQDFLCNITLFQEQQHAFPFPARATIIAWQFFNISASQVLLPILVAALYFSSPRAPSMLINVVLTWIVYGLVASILLYSGHADPNSCEPPPLLCLMDASLYIALPTLVTTAIFNAVLQIFFDVRKKLAQSVDEKDHTVRRICMLVSPYIVYAIFATAIAASGASGSYEKTVSRTRRIFYCSVRSNFLSNAVIGFCAIVLFTTLAFGVWTAVALKNHWTRLHRSVNSRLDFGYIFRMFGFFIYVFVALTLALLPKKVLVLEDMLMALMGYVVLLVFGTRRTILNACLTHLNCFYRYRKSRESKTADKMQMFA
ncbi:hypothetical protein M422DRAFT_22969 [Sphaerobolus stellatus SS14]|nr:hypothetical protein M422DRAFT_22969 [Sphaerobolus stellatus SS14]